MRHRVSGRKLGRNTSHRKALFRSMSCALIRTVRIDEDDPQKPKVPGRIVTTLAKAKELRRIVEPLVTLARRSLEHSARAAEFATSAERGSDAWKQWRESEQWRQWNQTIAPAVAARRRAFAFLRDPLAVDILFDELATRYEDRPGGYTRVVRLPEFRLGDAGRKAIIEFVGVGDRDRVRTRRRPAPTVTDEEQPTTPAPAAAPAGGETAQATEPQQAAGGQAESEQQS